MSSYTADQLDISRLPPFKLVEVDGSAERSALALGVKARLEARGIPFDANEVEAEPAMALVEEFALRKVLDLEALNAAGRRLTVAYGYGAALDHIAATYYADIGIRRLPLVEAPRPFATQPEDWESDARFRRRIELAPHARTPGTLGGYEYWALTAAPDLSDARALNHSSGLVSPGQILIVLLAEPDADEAEQVALATTALLDRDVKLGTDTLLIRAATPSVLDLASAIELRRGPDPALVLLEATAGQIAYLSARRRIGWPVTVSGLHAALSVPGVERVRLPVGFDGVDPGADGVVVAGALSVTPEVVNG